MTTCRLFRCLMLGTALVVAALAAACDGPRTDPAPSLAPTAATAPSLAPTATTAPGPAPTPATALMPTPSPTGIEPAPAPTPRPSPEPTLQERIDTLFSDYQSNAPFNDHLNKLSDYQNPTQNNLASFETLAEHATQDFELTKKAVIAAGFLGLDSSEANLTIDAYLKHQQKYGLQDPTGFASVTDLILFQNQLNTPGKIRLADGQEEDRRGYILSSEERIEALIAGSDIWSWLALPERDLATMPEWVIKSYPPDELYRQAYRQTVFQGPFSLNGSSDIRFSASPWFTDDSIIAGNNSFRGSVDPELFSKYAALNPIRQQWLNGLNFQPNSTAVDLDALATGNLEETGMWYSFAQSYRDIATNRLDFLVVYKTEIIAGLEPRVRAFVDDTGDLSAAFVSTNFDKSIFVQIIDSHDSGAFRGLGVYDNANNRIVFPVQDNENITLYVTGRTFRFNESVWPTDERFDGRKIFDPESWGIMYVTPDGKDPGGNFDASVDYTIDKDGKRFTFGEPKLVALDEAKFPFIDQDKTNELWTKENVERAKIRTYGVNWGLNPAAIDEGHNKDPVYGNLYVGPHFLVFDNRKDAPK